MKKLIAIVFSFLLFLPSIFASSYQLPADVVVPGVFNEGDYYFPSTLYVGAASYSGLGSVTPALVIGNDAGSSYGIYYSGSEYAYPLLINSGYTGLAYGVYAKVTNGVGVYGETEDSSGIYGKATGTGDGVKGTATGGGAGVYGYDSSGSGIGVKAASGNYGVYVTSISGGNAPAYGVYVTGADSYGVYVADSDHYGGKFVGASGGVYGEGDYYGVYGTGASTGVRGDSDTIGVYGSSSSSTSRECGIKGYNSASGKTGYIGCYNKGIYTPDDAKVDGELSVGSLAYADIAEHFIGNTLEAGDVVVLDPAVKKGVKKTNKAYDKLAAGIVSTNPTITMGLEEGIPIALSGVVPTKVIGTVHVGDLLTTSALAGYAMACADYQKCQGAIIGKAMEEQEGGKGIITALVMLG